MKKIVDLKKALKLNEEFLKFCYEALRRLKKLIYDIKNGNIIEMFLETKGKHFLENYEKFE